ncbi:phosphotransferase [Aureivirga sp. CE67]|uniref:phosphotransferase n=1 Tax=Aureivirga sp. CE67 TaxID=1788983 RepID=UPI0018CBEB0F|nr:phosphotransferase [Aureivirga sp. CE67]
MKNNQISSSIFASEFITKYVAKNYHFIEKSDTSILKTGISHNYLISEENQKYVFRVYFKDWRTREEIEEEIKLLNYLHQNGISVSFPLKDTDGNYIQEVEAPEGKRFAVLFSYADGDFVRNPDEKDCFEFGKTIAKMHQLLENQSLKRINYNAESLIGWAYEKSKEMFSEEISSMQYFKRAKEKVEIAFDKADKTQLKKGVVHLDLWYQNMKKDNGKFTFFDFDNCGNGFLFLDLSYALMLLFKNEPNKELFVILREAFYEGYESILPITNEEKHLIPYGGLAIWLHYTGIHVVRFDDFTNHFLSEEFLSFWIQIVDQWMRFNEIEI